MLEEGQANTRELAAKHEKELADLLKVQEAEKESATKQWKFKLDLAEKKIEARQGNLERGFREEEEKMEKEWAEKRVY